MDGFERLDLAEAIAEAFARLSRHIGMEAAVIDLCENIDDDTLQRCLAELHDTLAEGLA